MAIEASGLIFNQIPCFSSSSISCGDSKPCFSSSRAIFPGARSSLSGGFHDNGHVQYYNTGVISRMADGVKDRKGPIKLNNKKKHLKLLKNLSKDLSTFSQIGFGLDLDPDCELLNQVQGTTMTEAAEILLQQLQKLKSEKDVRKMKRKEEKNRLKSEARMKKTLLVGEMSSTSSSSESSDDSECGEVINMKKFKLNQAKSSHSVENAISLPPLPPKLAIPVLPDEEKLKSMTENDTAISSSIFRDITETASNPKVEVCMGGKCKKSGGADLILEFEKVLGVDGTVSGCKCMGKCKEGPNVRVMDNLFIGVGLEDVNTIVANFVGDQSNELRRSPAVC